MFVSLRDLIQLSDQLELNKVTLISRLESGLEVVGLHLNREGNTDGIVSGKLADVEILNLVHGAVVEQVHDLFHFHDGVDVLNDQLVVVVDH